MGCIAEKTDGQPALSLIVTPESLVQLTARLAPWCVVDADDYTVGLSFADTRILPELIKVLTSQQLAQFCGPALLWQYVTRDAQWFTLPLTDHVAEPSLAVSMDAQQCSRLMAAAEADNVLFQLRTTAPNLVDCYTPARAHSSVQYWLTCADHAQLDAAPERAGLCELGLTYPALEHDSQTAAWLETPSKPYTFEALRTQLQDMLRIL